MTHPDDLVMMINELAKSHGYGVTEIELISRNTKLIGVLPRHFYSVETIDVITQNGTLKPAQ